MNMNKEIDELICDTVSILNEKGYITNYSCQGHSKEDSLDYTNIYISFEELHINKIIDGLKTVRLPKGFKFDSIHVIRKFITGDSVEEQEKEIIKSNKALNRWANRLPPYNSK